MLKREKRRWSDLSPAARTGIIRGSIAEVVVAAFAQQVCGADEL